MEMPDVIYVEHSADEWVNGKYIPLYEGGTQWDGNKTEYHHSRIVEDLKTEIEKLKPHPKCDSACMYLCESGAELLKNENERLKKQIQRWEDAHSEMIGEVELRRRIAELEAIIEARGM